MRSPSPFRALQTRPSNAAKIVPDAVLFAAVGDTLAMLAAFGALAALMVIIRDLSGKPRKFSKIEGEKR